MQIRRLDPAGYPQDAAAVYPAFRQWHLDYEPGLPAPGKTRLRHWVTSGYRRKTLVFGAFPDEDATEALGVATYTYELESNLDLAAVELDVTAVGRTRGAETALFETALRQTAELGRKRLSTGMPETMTPAPFVEQYGGKFTDAAIMSTLDLSAIDRSQYEEWERPSARNSEYTLVAWSGRCPDELAESYCSAMDAMADQPLGTFEYEFAKYSVDRLRFGEKLMDEVGARRYVQVALDAEGAVAGFHVIGTYPDEPERADVWDTGVARSHRGHGLGLRMKAAASLWLLEDRPGTRTMLTYNNDENQWMLAVNRAMGYKPLVDYPSYEFAV
jgi:GNAT superfamily N-acetyltransferase